MQTITALPVPLLALVLGMACSACSAAPAAAAQVQRPLHVATQPVPNSGRQDRIDELAARARGAHPTLVFLGDSITEQWESTGAEVWARHYAALGALGLGVGGDQTQHVLWRLRQGHLDGLQPRVLVLLIGTNNLGAGNQSPEQIADGVGAILDELRSRMPDTRVLLLGVFPRGDSADDPFRARVQILNGLLAPLADGEHVRWVDFGSVFLQPGGAIAPEIMPDALHLSAAGYELWAQAMDGSLKRALAATATR